MRIYVRHSDGLLLYMRSSLKHIRPANMTSVFLIPHRRFSGSHSVAQSHQLLDYSITSGTHGSKGVPLAYAFNTKLVIDNLAAQG